MKRLQSRQPAVSKAKPTLGTLQDDVVGLPEGTLDRHVSIQPLHNRGAPPKVVQHRAGTGLHEHAPDRVARAIGIVEMREPACVEAIERYVIEHPRKRAFGAHELERARRRRKWP